MSVNRNLSPTIVLAFALAFFASTVFATTWGKAGIESNIVVVDGKLFFVQPDSSLTAMDVVTGEVLLRRDIGVSSLHPLTATEHGLMVRSSAGLLLLDPDTLNVVFEEQIYGCHFTRDKIICPQRDWRRLSPWTARVVCRSLVDGRVLWSYGTRGLRGEILTLNDRVMFTMEDRERQVEEVAILDLETGREMAREPVEQDVDLRIHAFDGDRILLKAQPSESHPCQTTLWRVLELQPESGSLSSRDLCRDEPGESWRGAVLAGSGAMPVAQQEEEVLRVSPVITETPGGFFIEPDSTFEWWALIPGSSDLPIGRWWQVDDILVVERLAWNLGVLDCFDVRSGEPRWTYVFPSRPVMRSTTLPHMRTSYVVSDLLAGHDHWKAVLERPPLGAVLLPDSPFLRKWADLVKQYPMDVSIAARFGASAGEEEVRLIMALLGQADISSLGTASGATAFDPQPFCSLPRAFKFMAYAWGTLALPFLGLWILRRRGHLAKELKKRRAILWISVTFCLGLFLYGLGHIDPIATWTAKLVLIGAFFIAAVMAIRIRTVVTLLFLLILAAIGMLSLPLLLLA